MTKIKLLLVAALFSSAASAQIAVPADNNHWFNCDVGIMVPFAPGDNSVGFGGYTEPKFNLLNFLAIGLKFEGYVAFGGKIPDIDYGDVSFRMMGLSSTSFTTDVIAPLEGIFRPFVGMGIGRYTYASQSISTNTVNITQEAGVSWGISPRAGIQIGPFRMSVEYNYLFEPSTYVYQEVSVGGPLTGGTLSRSYFGFKLGGIIGWKNKTSAP